MGLMRSIAPVLVAALLGGMWIASPSPVEAAASREMVRLSLLDACVAGEWKKRSDTSKIADECRCASQKAAGQLTAAQVSAYKNKLDRSGLEIWEAATKACFKSNTASAKP